MRKKTFVGIPDGNVFLGCEILTSYSRISQKQFFDRSVIFVRTKGLISMFSYTLFCNTEIIRTFSNGMNCRMKDRTTV